MGTIRFAKLSKSNVGQISEIRSLESGSQESGNQVRLKSDKIYKKNEKRLRTKASPCPKLHLRN